MDLVPDVHALSGAYAVDALHDAERARFEAHLAVCAACRDEVDSLREAAARLAADATLEPPAAVRAGLLDGIATIRPLPPVGTGATVTELAGRRRSPHAGRVRLLAGAAAVVLLALGAVGLRPWTTGQSGSPHYTVAERVLAAPDAVRVDKRFPDRSEATVVRSASVGRAVIVTDDMSPTPAGEDYELWLQTPAGEMVPAGLMPDVRDVTYVLQGDASRATGVGITVEPDGGSPQPTSEPIAFFSLES